MRDLVEVLDAIIAEIPASETRALTSIKAVQASAKFTAPEIMSARWNQAAAILEHDIGEPKEDWQKKVAAIFCGRDDYDEEG